MSYPQVHFRVLEPGKCHVTIASDRFLLPSQYCPLFEDKSSSLLLWVRTYSIHFLKRLFPAAILLRVFLGPILSRIGVSKLRENLRSRSAHHERSKTYSRLASVEARMMFPLICTWTPAGSREILFYMFLYRPPIPNAICR